MFGRPYFSARAAFCRFMWASCFSRFGSGSNVCTFITRYISFGVVLADVTPGPAPGTLTRTRNGAFDESFGTHMKPYTRFELNVAKFTR